MEMSVPVSVIIVSFNTKDLTRKALEALFRSDAQPKQVIVVDNASSDGSADMVRAEFPNVTVVSNAENKGFAEANNQGLALTDQPYVWFLNSDTETGIKTLGQLVEYMEVYPRIGAVGPQLVYPNGSLQSVGGFFPTTINVFLYFIPIHKLLPDRIVRKLRLIGVSPQLIPKDGLNIDYATGAALFVRKKAVDRVNGFPTHYFMYFEETDLCYRLQQNGWEIKVIDVEPVMHVAGGSYKTQYDRRRLKAFISGLRTFTRTNYRGVKKMFILTECAFLASISMFLKRKFGNL